MAGLEPEVPGQPAAASGDGFDVDGNLVEESGIGVPAEHGVVVAVHLGQGVPVRVGNLRRGPTGAVSGQQLGQGDGLGAEPFGDRVAGEQLGGIRAERPPAGGRPFRAWRSATPPIKRAKSGPTAPVQGRDHQAATSPAPSRRTMARTSASKNGATAAAMSPRSSHDTREWTATYAVVERFATMTSDTTAISNCSAP